MDGQLVASVKNGPHHLNAAETVVVNLIPGKFRNDKIIYPDLRVIYLRQEAFALKTFRDGQIHILHDHGRQVDMAHRVFVNNSLRHAGTGDHQGNPGDFIVHDRPLGIQAVALQGIAVVGCVDDQGIRGTDSDAVQHPPDFGVRKGIAAQIIGNFDGEGIPVAFQILSGPVFLVLGLSLQGIPHIGGFGKFIVFKHGGIRFRTESGIMGFVQGNSQKKVLVPVFM